MSIPIEVDAQVTVSIVRRGVTMSATGNPTESETTLESSVVCDIQPTGGDISELLSGVDPRSTHTMYPQDRITTALLPGDIAVNGDLEYELLFVHDYTGAHQELDLRQVSGDK